MTRTLFSTCMAMVWTALAANGWAAEKRTPGETVDDTTLGLTVKYQLVSNQDVPAREINVEVHKGVVQMSGFLQSAEQKAAAMATAEKIEGVTVVDDALIVSSTPRSLGQFIDDQTIEGKLRLAMAKFDSLDPSIATVIHVRNSEVLLAGFVDSNKTRTKVIAAARGIEGVEKTYNHILTR